MNENDFFELEDDETETEEDPYLPPVVVGAFLGIGGILAGKALTVFAVNKLRQKYYQRLGIETAMGEVLYPTSVGGKIVFQKITNENGTLIIEIVKPQKEEWVNVEEPA